MTFYAKDPIRWDTHEQICLIKDKLDINVYDFKINYLKSELNAFKSSTILIRKRFQGHRFESESAWRVTLTVPLNSLYF